MNQNDEIKLYKERLPIEYLFVGKVGYVLAHHNGEYEIQYNYSFYCFNTVYLHFLLFLFEEDYLE